MIEREDGSTRPITPTPADSPKDPIMPQKWTEDEWAIKRAGIVWSEREKDLLREIDDRISGNVRALMNNRELQQAIRETFEMWSKTPPEYDSGGNIEKHFNTLLNLQLIRARGGVVE